MSSEVSSELSTPTNYEELYHVLNRRRGEEIFMLKKIAFSVAGLLHTFEATDRLVADCAEAQGETRPAEALPVPLDKHIHNFLLRLDPHCYLKRYTDTWLVLKIMLQEGDRLKTMSKICARAAEEAGCTSSRIVRNLRNYRIAVNKANTVYYQENLAEFNTANSLFYWSALRFLQEEWEQTLLAVTESRQD